MGLVVRATSPHRCHQANWLRTILGLNMRYLDTGGRNPQECLGDWLTRTLQDQGIVELRLQTGYFSLDGASLLISARRQTRKCAPVEWLAGLLGLFFLGDTPQDLHSSEIARQCHAQDAHGLLDGNVGTPVGNQPTQRMLPFGDDLRPMRAVFWRRPPYCSARG